MANHRISSRPHYLQTLAILVTGRHPLDCRANAQLLSGVMGSESTATPWAELLLWSELSKVQQEGGSPSLPRHAPMIEPFSACLRCHSVCKHILFAVAPDKTIPSERQMTHVKRRLCVISAMTSQASIKHGKDLF